MLPSYGTHTCAFLPVPPPPPSVRCLESQINPNELTHLIITHLGPNRIPTLVDVMRSAYQGRSGTPLTLVGTNPAMKALQDALTGRGEGGGGRLSWV